MDPESRRWLRDLSAAGPERQRAVGELHALLLRAARFEVGRRGGGRGEAHDDLALQAADDALMSVLRRLGEFRGESRFTTWAYKFALLEAAVKVRRRAWQDREVVLDADSWRLVPDAAGGPEDDLATRELLRAVERAIREGLTAHQREVLVALAVRGVPVDVLAERRGTTRGALYKTLHDARRALRARLRERGVDVDGMTGE